MSSSARILRNVASNWTGFAVNAIVTLILTPFVLKELGEARYGIWVLTSSVIGYYGMLDLGFRAGVNQFLTRSIAVPDFVRASSVISTAFFVLSLLGIFLGCLSLVVAYSVPILFDLPPTTVHEAFWCILIVGMTAAIQCALSPFSAIFVAKQRFDLSNLIGVSVRLLSATAIYTSLKLGYGLIGVSLATGCGTLLEYSIRYVVGMRLVPELEVSRKHANFAQLREVGSFGLWNFLISVSQYVYLHLQPLIIGLFLPISAVGHYALAAGLWVQINGIFSPIGQVLYPAAAEMDVRGDRESLKRLYCDGSRLIMLVVIPVVLIAAVWAEDFYRLWIGEKFLTESSFTSVATLLRILLIGTLLSYTSNIAAQIVLAAGHVRGLALAQIAGAISNMSASILLINKFGLAGVAAAGVIAVFVVDIIGIPRLLSKYVRISIRDFYRDAWWRLTAVSVVSIAMFAGLRDSLDVSNWYALILSGIIAGTAALVSITIFGLKQPEKKRLIYDSIASISAYVRTTSETKPR